MFRELRGLGVISFLRSNLGMQKYLDSRCLFGYAVGFTLSMWGSASPTVHTLWILMWLDLITGIISGFIRREFNSKITFRGLLKKSLILIMVEVGHQTSDLLHIDADIGVAVAGFYCVNELLSIVENCSEAGVRIPSALEVGIEKLRVFVDLQKNKAQGEIPKEIPGKP